MDGSVKKQGPGRGRVLVLLELIRLPGMFTAHADILAAFVFVKAGSDHLSSLFWLVLASSCLFSAGMALNDYFDAARDARERPGRPIPSGRISRSAALFLGGGLILAGVGAAWMATSLSFFISLALAATILLYDGLLKRSLAGPFAMALCRYLNFLMGLSVLPFEGWFLVPLITAVYILGVTILSRKEARGGKAVMNIGGCTLCIGCSFVIFYFLYLNQMITSFLAVILMFGLMTCLALEVLRLLEFNQPIHYQGTMKTLLLAIILLDTIIALGGGLTWAAVLIPGLYFPAKLSVRLFNVT